MGEVRAAFFDRDGILVRPVDGEAPQRLEDLSLLPESIPVVRAVRQCGFLTIVVSNQPDAALGFINESTRRSLEKKFTALAKESNLPIDAISYCHHHPRGVVVKYTKDCSCRKPKPGMIINAGRKFAIDLRHSYMIGDRASDVKAGCDAGVTTILFDPEGSQQEYLKKLMVQPDYTVKHLKEVVNILCKP